MEWEQSKLRRQADDSKVVAGGVRPSFIKLPQTSISVHEYEPLTLRCVVDGHPKPAGCARLRFTCFQSHSRHLLPFLELVKPKFHYADFPETSPSGDWGSFGEVGVMEFGLKGTSRVCRRLVADATGSRYSGICA